MIKNMKKFLLIVFIATLSSCLSKKFDGPEQLGGQLISASTLNLGHDTYMQYCFQCHGMNGDGLGPAAYGSNPPPRNFQQGQFKFGSVLSGELPTDEDLKRTIRYGLRGTPMLPWDISEERLDAVVQYLKTFSPEWKTKEPGTPLVRTADPWGIQKASEAIELGKKVYHGISQCYSCHPSYAPLEYINKASMELTDNATPAMREVPHLSINQDSSYGHKYMPPDFTKNWIRTGGDIESLYQVLGTGVGGTTMPSWKGVLSTHPDEATRERESEERLWAMAYYVNSLHKLKFDSEARKRFFKSLNAARSKDITN